MSNLVVEAMTGVTVYDPQVSSVDDPKDLMQKALSLLSKGPVGAGLSPTIGVDRIEFRPVQGSPTVDATAAQEWDALPGRLRNLLVRNNLNPANYDTQCFLTDKRDYLRTMYAVAVSKATTVGGEPPASHYSIKATSKTPAPVIFLLDVSASMGELIDDRPRIEVVAEALQSTVRRMVARGTIGKVISRRYIFAIFAYSDEVSDLLGGFKGVDQFDLINFPPLSLRTTTNTAKAFEEAEKLLKRELPNLQACPAPLICHMTDGEYNGPDPEPVVRRIMQMCIPDGCTQILHVFINPNILDKPIKDLKKWPGIFPDTPLANAYAAKLRDLASPLAPEYRKVMNEYGYGLQEGAVMMLPGMSSDLVSLGFQMSMSTPK